MEFDDRWRLRSDWYSPTRLHGSPLCYDFQGDRFIPNRSLMDLDQARSLLTPKNNIAGKPNLTIEYRRKLEENLYLDSEGRPFRMLVFRGSPKTGRKSIRLIDEMRRSDEEPFNHSTSPNQPRRIAKVETKILDAPTIIDDYYVNIMDWGQTNILAVGLGTDVYLYDPAVSRVEKVLQAKLESDYPTSVSLSGDGRILAVGFSSSELQLWDTHTCKMVRRLEGHWKGIGTLSWNGHILTSGSFSQIVNHDARVRNSLMSSVQAHRGPVCGLKWSGTGNVLASGGNDGVVYIWEASKMRSSQFMHRFTSHIAAVKALAWCPYNSDVLASGGGTKDGCIKFWNVQSGSCITSIETKAQVCGLEWNKHHKEILSGHGFSTIEEYQNRLCLWKYPSMDVVGDVTRHSSRVLQLAQSPDGLTAVSAGADETLRFWEFFGPPQAEKVSNSPLSLRASLIR